MALPNTLNELMYLWYSNVLSGITTTVSKIAGKDGTTIASSSNPIPVEAVGNVANGAGTDRSVAITTGGTAQQLAAANTLRTFLKGQNISTGDIWINEIGGTAAVDTLGSFKIPSGATFSINTNRAVSVIGATTGQKITATEG